jgi:hypothetical protein
MRLLLLQAERSQHALQYGPIDPFDHNR